MKNILYIFIAALFTLSLNAQTDASSSVFSASKLDRQPEYPLGLQGFYSFINTRFVVPETKEDLHVKIYVSFVIEIDGSMSNIKLLRDPGLGLGEEAVRVLKLVPLKWKPGMVGTKDVRSSYNLPITINVESPPVAKNNKAQ